MKQRIRKVVFGQSLRKLGKIETRVVREMVRAVTKSKKMPRPVVIISPEGRRFEFWDVDFEG